MWAPAAQTKRGRSVRMRESQARVVFLRAIPKVLHSAHMYLMCLDVGGSALVLVGAVVAVKEAVEGDKLPVER